MIQRKMIKLHKTSENHRGIFHFAELLFLVLALSFGVNLIACSGEDGADGINGANGRDGLNGINGINGVDGKDGVNGKDGKDGKDAVVNIDSLADAIRKELAIRDSGDNNSQNIIQSLYAEDLEIKTNVYGSFANQYSLMYEEFLYPDDNGDTAMLPMPFPILIANQCDSMVNTCHLEKILIKSWIQGFTDTSTITQVVNPGEEIVVSPMFSFDDEALLALTSPKKVQRHVEAYAFENNQKILFYSVSKTVTIHPMQVFGALEEIFNDTISLYPEVLMPYWFSVFVTPTADSISKMVGEIAKKLPEGKLLVYQKYDADLSIELSLKRVAKAVFEILQSRNIKYIENTGAASIGQRINYPVETLRKKEGICIETAVLFASVLERLGFDAYIVLIPGHAFVGWATEEGGALNDFLETTMIGDANVTFEEANEAGIEEFQNEVLLGNIESGESAVISIKIARNYGILPNNIP